MREDELEGLALRLEADEKLNLRYRWPIAVRTDGSTEFEERVDPLLDVAEETGVLFVSQGSEVMRVNADEAIEILPA